MRTKTHYTFLVIFMFHLHHTANPDQKVFPERSNQEYTCYNCTDIQVYAVFCLKDRTSQLFTI